MPNRPNLVLVDCHDLGRHLGCYGRAAVPSDHLDAFAADGVRFARHFCTAPQCSPSRAALYTGRHAHAVGMLGLAHAPFDWRLHADETHLARHLADGGWRTAHVGVQHVTENAPDAVRALGFERHEAAYAPAAELAAAAEAMIADLTTGDAPFFLNVGFFEPHREAEGAYRRHPPRDARGVDRPPYLPDDPAIDAELAALQGSIGAMDAAFGRILDALDAAGASEDTWVVFTTDHGLALPRAKGTMYDAGLEAALLMRWPAAGLAGGRIVDPLTSHVDLLPTLLEGLGLPLPGGLHGRSLGSLLTGSGTGGGAEGGAPPRARIFAEKTFHTAYEPQRALRTERHKLVLNLEVDITNVPGDVQRSPAYPAMLAELTAERPPVELYDLERDPLERDNLAGRPEHVALETELKRELLGWMRRTGDPILAGPVASPYYRRALVELGAAADEDANGGDPERA